ncbi:unnamed protein product [Oncorhynchus mykiss]|uniref:Uncharacterized protein n=1 Tax=Oncorhynchus mykiss TaxID=8022 RepID=A0A060XYG7_ONCMY|nr:unnamed protein product [Oncorhynchus mykiss]
MTRYPPFPYAASLSLFFIPLLSRTCSWARTSVSSFPESPQSLMAIMDRLNKDNNALRGIHHSGTQWG